MTFQEAVKIIYANDESEKISVYRQAIETAKWYENNVLELEDYETDQLYKVLAFINENKLEVQTMKTQNEQVQLTADQLEFLGKELSTIMRVLETQKNYLEFLPNPVNGNAEKNALNYHTFYQTTNNTYDLLSDIVEKLDTYSLLLLCSTDEEVLKQYKTERF